MVSIFFRLRLARASAPLLLKRLDIYYETLCKEMISIIPAMLALTCDDVKTAYIESSCCGDNSNAPVSNLILPIVSRLSSIQTRGSLNCGVKSNVEGMSLLNTTSGEYSGLETDICRAYAAAMGVSVNFVTVSGPMIWPNVFATSETEFVSMNTALHSLLTTIGVPLPPEENFTYTPTDVAVRQVTSTMQRELSFMGLPILPPGKFAPVYFYDEAALVVSNAFSGVTQLSHLDGTTYCVGSGTTHEVNFASYASAMNLNVTQLLVGSALEAKENLVAGACQFMPLDGQQIIFTQDVAYDFGFRYREEPLAPIMRTGEDDLLRVLNAVWTVIVQAAGLDYTKEKAELVLAGTGSSPLTSVPFVQTTYLTTSWADHVISTVGNYIELMSRWGKLGGMNQLNKNGGVQTEW